MKKVFKRVITFVLSLAMVVTSVNFTSTTVSAAAIDDIGTERNLALGKSVTYSGYKPDGAGTTEDKVTDGSVATTYFAVTYNNDGDWHGGKPCHITVDLGDYYDASSIDEVLVAYKNDSTGSTVMEKTYSIDYSVNGTVFENVYTSGTVESLGENHETVDDVSSATGKVRYVKISYPKSGNYGIQIKEIAVLADNPVKTTFTPIEDAQSVTLESNDYNSLTYTITAAEGQDGFVYDVYLENGTKIGEDVAAGTYTVNNIDIGTHSVSVVSKYNGSISAGIQSNEVEVINEAIAAARQFKSTKNLTYVGNNPYAKFVSATSFYSDKYTTDTASVIFDGDIETRGEGASVAYRSAANEKPISFIVDLGGNYTASQLDKIMLEYQNNLTYAGTTKVYVAETNDEDIFTLVGEKENYKPVSGDPYNVNTVDLDMSQYGLAGVRYIKIELDKGSVAYGYVLHECGVLLNVDVADATLATPKTKYTAPTIPSKEYTGQLQTADVPASNDYTVVTNAGGVNAGEYDVVLKLNDFGTYYWDVNKAGGDDKATLKFVITQAANEWTTDLDITGWTYGQNANAPTATAKFGTPTYTYSDAEDGTFTDEVPTSAGKHYVKASVPATNNYAGISATKEFNIAKADKAAPTGISTIKATANQNADGSITNVDSTMEYKKTGDANYTSVEGTTISNILPGTYQVRYKETANYNASADATITVESGRMLLVTLSESLLYEIKPQKESREVAFDEEYKFSVDIPEGYRKGADFAVLANGEAVSETAGVYTVVIKGDTLIEVVGIEEDIPDAPTITAENTAFGVATVKVIGMPDGDVANIYMNGVQIQGYVENGEYTVEGLTRGNYTFTAESVRGIYTSDLCEPVTIFVDGEFTISDMMKDPEYNLSLGKNIVISQWIAEGQKASLNDGNISTYGALSGDEEKEGFGEGKPCYMVLDLEKTYDASTLGDVVIDYRKSTAGDAITVKTKPYTIAVSSDGVNYQNIYTTRSARYTDEANNRTINNIPQCIENAEVDVTKIRYIRVFYEKTPAYGMQITEFAVIAPEAQEVEVEKCANANSVEVASEVFNEITYTIEAAEGQEDFVYNVYLDDDLKNPVALGVAAGEEHKIAKVSAGAHTLTIVSVDNGKLSDGLVSQEVTVLDGDIEYTKLLTGDTNIASKNNNPRGRIINVSSFYSTDYNLTQSQVAIDGKVERGEAPETTLRTGANVLDATIIIDLGSNYSAKQIEKVAIEYQNGRTYAANTKVWVAEQNKENYYALVADASGYKATNENSNNVNSITLDKSEYGMSGIRFVKIQISGGAVNYGYMIHEIGVLLNTEASNAEIVEPKIAVEIPTLADKVYTGETLTADIPNNNLYEAYVNEGGVNAGEYPVTLVLKDFEHYFWEGDIKGASDKTDVTFNITQAENNWINTVDIDGWTYGENAKAPSASAKFGEVIYSYGKSLDGSFTSAPPTDAGNYYVKAHVDETANYKGIVCTKEFTVGKGVKTPPVDLIARSSTLVGNADASIIGVSTAMEYRPADAGSYYPIYGDVISNIKSGLYYVRYKETNNTLASEDTPVLVESGRKLTVTFAEGDHYTITNLDDSDRYTYGTSCRFQVKIADGYQKGANFKVTANGDVVKGEGDIYTVDAITSETLIEVTGIEIKPTQAPTTVAPTYATPAKAKIKKVYAKKKSAKKLKVAVKAVAGATGYRWAVFQTKKNAQKNKKALYKKNTTKKTITLTSAKIKNKKTLFVRVRAYVIQPNGTYTYGAWSTVKKVKIKK